ATAKPLAVATHSGREQVRTQHAVQASGPVVLLLQISPHHIKAKALSFQAINRFEKLTCLNARISWRQAVYGAVETSKRGEYLLITTLSAGALEVVEFSTAVDDAH